MERLSVTRPKIDTGSRVMAARVPSGALQWLLGGLMALAMMAALAAPAPARDAPASFADLAQQLLPAVVNISTTQTVQRRHAPEMPQFRPARRSRISSRTSSSTASDRTAAAQGNLARLGLHHRRRAAIVVTNNHVIGDADEITVIFTDGTQAEGRSSSAGPQDRPRAAAREARQAAQGGEVRRQRQGARRRLGDGDRQSVRPRRHGDGGHRLGPQPRHHRPGPTTTSSRPTRPSTGQLGRPAVQHGRRGDRHQHGDPVALRRLDRHRLRRPRHRWPSR